MDKKYLRKNYVLLLTCMILFASNVQALDHGFVKLPNSKWKLEKIDESTQELSTEKLGKVVTVRVATADLGKADVNKFILLVRNELSDHQDYAGARFSQVSSQTIKQDRWLYFSLKRQDDVHQELWAKQLEDQSAVVFLYTATDKYYKKFRKDYLKLLKQIN